MSREATLSVQLEVGDSVIDADHRPLAELLEGLERVCADSANPDCRCGECPERKAHACHGRLKAICGQVQTLLLDHFQREHALMDSLPRTPAARTHCERHRREHVNFSTRYNLAAARLNDCQPALGAKEIEVLIFDWIGGHAATFDAELAALLKRPVQPGCR